MKLKLSMVLGVVLMVILVLSMISCGQPAASTTVSPTKTTSAPVTTSAAPAPITAAPIPAKVYKLSFALFQPATAGLSVANTAFAKEIEKRTNGQVQITVLQGGSLLNGPSMYMGVRNGIADMGNSNIPQNPDMFPFTETIAGLATNTQSGWALSYAQYDFLMKYPTEFNNVHVLTTAGGGCDAMAIGTAKAPILKLEDFKGKSIRTSCTDITVALGATIKDVPMAEVYDSISKGVLDGFIASPEPLKSWKLGDVCKYVTLNTAPVQPSALWYNIMNKDKWNSLPPDIQKTITDVSVEYTGKLGLAWGDQSIAGVQYCKSLGDSVYVLPQDEAARWAAAITPTNDASLKKLTTKGFTQQEVQDAWNYFKSRVDYWNGQQAQNNVTPLLAQLEAALK